METEFHFPKEKLKKKITGTRADVRHSPTPLRKNMQYGTFLQPNAKFLERDQKQVKLRRNHKRK